MSLSPSPARLKASTIRVIAIPGQNISQGFLDMKLRASPMIFPQDGVSGLIPTPRKLRPDSIRIAKAVMKLAITTTEAIIFAIIYLT